MPDFSFLKCIKFNVDWGSAPDPTRGAYSAPPYPLAGFGEGKGKGRTKGREGRRKGRKRGKGKRGREGERMNIRTALVKILDPPLVCIISKVSTNPSWPRYLYLSV